MFDPDDNSVMCAKGKIYQTTPPSEFEYKSGLILWSQSESGEKIPLTMNILYFYQPILYIFIEIGFVVYGYLHIYIYIYTS